MITRGTSYSAKYQSIQSKDSGKLGPSSVATSANGGTEVPALSCGTSKEAAACSVSAATGAQAQTPGPCDGGLRASGKSPQLSVSGLHRPAPLLVPEPHGNPENQENVAPTPQTPVASAHAQPLLSSRSDYGPLRVSSFHSVASAYSLAAAGAAAAPASMAAVRLPWASIAGTSALRDVAESQNPSQGCKDALGLSKQPGKLKCIWRNT